MQAWRDYVREHTTSAAKAVEHVQSGDRIALAHACGEPRQLPIALVGRANSLRDVEIVHMIALGQAPYCQSGYEGSFRHVSLFAGPGSRDAIREGRADFLPVFFGQIPHLLTSYLPVDVAMVTVSPPDKAGWCSLGVSVDYTKPAVEQARLVLAEVNPSMPRTHGDSFVHVSQIDWFIPVDEPILELPPAPLGEVDRAIGKHVASLVDDESCLQLGIGGIPDAVLANLHGHKDLGIHSEMISDGVIDLVEAGVVTCRKKTLHRGKMVLTLLMGSRRLYDWVDDNPFIEMHTVDYVNNPYVIARNRKMVSINSALEVDLLGQVSADTLGAMQYSGIGGQVDFVRGASLAEGGKAIIALPSTAKGGSVSRIVAMLAPGSAVTTSRQDVDYIITEHGVAHLKGSTVRQRIQALVSIAAPVFREELERKAHEIYWG